MGFLAMAILSLRKSRHWPTIPQTIEGWWAWPTDILWTYTVSSSFLALGRHTASLWQDGDPSDWICSWQTWAIKRIETTERLWRKTQYLNKLVVTSRFLWSWVTKWKTKSTETIWVNFNKNCHWFVISLARANWKSRACWSHWVWATHCNPNTYFRP